MPEAKHSRPLVRLAAFLAGLLVSLPLIAQVAPPYVYSGPLLPLLMQMPENSWLKANAGPYSAAWTPDDLEPLDNGVTHTPAKIILPWSGFAWDSNRGDIILWGGGHANYSGNDVYRWHSGTLLWERAALPSEIRSDPVVGFLAIDGPDNAPISSHTYDNNIFLPIADRMLTWGGATYNNGGPFIRVLESNPSASRLTGPYLFDPNRANGAKVGGTTGSHVQRVSPHPEVVGGQMWQNRDINKWIAGQAPPGTHVNGCTGYASEGGLDVVYTGSANQFSTNMELYRYQVTDVANPSLDQSTKVGMYSVGVTGQTTCGYDPSRKLFVRTGSNAVPFQFWDLTTPGPANPDRSVQIDATIAGLQAWLSSNALNIQNCALEFDPVRGTFPLWCGASTVWELRPPPGGNTISGWTVVQRNAPQPAPPGDIQTGVMGKWRYAPFYDAFVGLQDINDGSVWIYKPVGWAQPNPAGNSLPTVTIATPAQGQVSQPGATVSLTANAADPGGSIARVIWFVNGVNMGQATSAPYALDMAPITVGNYTVVAIAVDNVGGMTASAPVVFSVSATLSTAVLQRGLNGYAGAADTFLDNLARTTVRGGSTPLYLDLANFTPLVRFAIFASEGGPVPDGAVVQSATLSLYKQSYDDPLKLNALSKAWTEGEATWTNARAGVAWSAGGAASPGNDFDPTVDATVSGSFNPGWVSFDVTDRVRQWSSGTGSNNGWRMTQGGTNSNLKQFNSAEYASDPTLRPKLTVVYSGGSSNQPPNVSLTSPAPGAAITLGQSFTLTASASDPDVGGSVTKVEFFANGASVGVTNGPFSMAWTPPATGSYSIVAVATDNGNRTATSAPVNVTVNPGSSGTSATLQRGLDGYAGASDTFLDNYLRTTVRGSLTSVYVDPVNYVGLVRFAIFQSEGGPVPNGATITTATLSLYKQYYNETFRLNRMLVPWVEGQATWNLARAGVPWNAAGASGAGTDYGASSDALVAAGFNPGWVDFDVTPRVQQWSSVGANFGWRLSQSGFTTNAKQFNSSEFADATLRPKLTVTWSGGVANTPPSVSIASPADGSSVTLGQAVTVTADASDAEGSVTRVEFFANGTSIGVTTGPFTLAWTPSFPGNYALTAEATDNGNLTKTSAPVSVTVIPGSSGTTVTLQRGNGGYAGVSETFLDNYLRTTVRGALATVYLDRVNYTPLIRFAIFQSEGGPVPDGATIQTATLSLYKQYYDDTLRLNPMFKPWVESEATWNLAKAGVPWTAGGAAAVGSDYGSTTDAQLTPAFSPGWVAFDVTARVQQWAASGDNFGWRMSQTTTGGNSKQFNASEYAPDPSLRPKLTITYQ
jgi:hypothetical protein